MQRSRILLLATALTVLGAGAACGGGGDGDKESGGSAAPADQASGDKDDDAGDDGGSTITVMAKEFAYDPKEIKLTAGQATTIVLKNGGAIEHDITIESPAFALKAQPTKTEQMQLTIPAAGSYTFYCTVPGHRQAGMEGTVTVS